MPIAIVLLTPWIACSSGVLSVFDAVHDATLQDVNGDGTTDSINLNDSILDVRNFPGATINKAVMGFDLQGYNTALLGEAFLTFEIFDVASNGPGVSVIGFVDDGAITADDGTIPGVSLAVFQPNSLGVGTHDVALSIAGMQQIGGLGLQRLHSIGIRMEGSDSANFSLVSLESSSGRSPQLKLSTVPEPSVVFGMFAVFFFYIVVARNRVASTSRCPQVLNQRSEQRACGLGLIPGSATLRPCGSIGCNQ